MRKIGTNKEIFSTIFLLIIFLLGLIIRFYKLGEIPQVLTRDEAAIGYNAYSILETGKDEYGVKFPLYFLSFGDYKNPLYIYLTTILIPIFGLREFTVRFISALSGSLTVLLAYYLIKELFFLREEKIKSFAFITSFLLAIAPFHIFYSRMAYEATLCLFFVLLGIIFLLKAQKRPIYFFFSLFFFILSFFTYNPPIFILPVLIPLVFFLFRKEYFEKSNKKWAIIFLILFYSSLGVYSFLSKELIVGRSQATIFSKDFYQNQMTLWEINKKPPPFGLNFFLRKKPFIFYKLISNYFSAFKSEFLFFKGDGHLWHGVGIVEERKIGNIYILFLPFFILGLFFILKEKKRGLIFILTWFLISPLACIFTHDSPNTTRLLEFLFLFTVISAFGINYFLSFFKKFSFVVFLILFFLFLVNLKNYLNIYFNYYPRAICQLKFSSMWPCGIKEVVKYLENKKYKKVFFVVETDSEVPYIQLSFYQKINPVFFQRVAERENKPFMPVKRLGKFYLGEVFPKKEVLEDEKIIIISRPTSFIKDIDLKEAKKIDIRQTIKIKIKKNNRSFFIEVLSTLFQDSIKYKFLIANSKSQKILLFGAWNLKFIFYLVPDNWDFILTY